MKNRLTQLKLLLLILTISLLSACGGSGESVVKIPPPIIEPEPEPEPGRILAFSKTAGYRHNSIAEGQAMLSTIASENGWDIDFTEDSSEFNTANLNRYSVVVWLSTTGDVLNASEQAAFEDYIESGAGYVGIHAASDTEYSWSWYGDLVGAYFSAHPEIQQATLVIENGSHQSTSHLDETWIHTDEWYNFQSNPRVNVNVLMTLDETSYNPGSAAMGDHPIAWYNSIGSGRSFYTGLGHTAASYQDQNFIDHIEGALVWAGKLAPSMPMWSGPPPKDTDFTSTVRASSINQPMELDVSSEGDIYMKTNGSDERLRDLHNVRKTTPSSCASQSETRDLLTQAVVLKINNINLL